MAMFIRLLSGGLYFDIAGCWSVYLSTIFQVFNQVLGWLLVMPFGMVDIKRYLSSDGCPETRLKESVKKAFSVRSGGCIDGCIGVLDGWLPKMQSNGRSAMFIRKGFHAINVQVFGDHMKRILWLSDKFCRATPDSSAFKNTTLYALLVKRFEELYERMECILGDSAYSIRLFLQVSYRNSYPDSTQDNFNCNLSKIRIFSECCLREMCARWVIFQRRMQFETEKGRLVIRAAAKLHNFSVDFRESTGNPDVLTFSGMVPYFKNLTSDVRKRGHPSVDESAVEALGIGVRNRLAKRLEEAGMTRLGESRKRRRNYGLQN